MTTGAPNRHQLREWVVQFLFQLDFNRIDPLDLALEVFLEHKKRRMSRKMQVFFDTRVRGVEANRKALDARIVQGSENWDLHRLNPVDRNVLRLALYELYHCEDVPPVVAVNEAVQLAKELSSEESGRFVNGILDKIIKTLDRPLRQGIERS